MSDRCAICAGPVALHQRVCSICMHDEKERVYEDFKMEYELDFPEKQEYGMEF